MYLLTLSSTVSFASSLKLSINKKLFAIKKLFYLPLEVKIQFFKTFIMPYFDFGLSLIIYYSKSAINILSKSYYACIFHLFKLNLSHKTQIEINLSLKSFNLYSLETKIFLKLCKFSFLAKNSPQAPEELKEILTDNQVIGHNYKLRSATNLYLKADKINESTMLKAF